MSETLPRYGRSEADEQEALMAWAWQESVRIPALTHLFAIPNGLAASSLNAARRMKAQGMIRGVPDLFLPYPIRPYAGLWIELKRARGGRLSLAQKSWLAYLNDVGYRAIECKGFDAAREAILDYLAIERTG